MIAATKGWCMFLGVPRQTTGLDYKELWSKYKGGDFDEWGTYTWKSAEVLSVDEIDRIKSQIDELTFRQEYEGEFVDYGGGLAYYAFNEKGNVGQTTLRRDLPVWLAMDFNTNPLIVNVGQMTESKHLAVLDEVVDRHSNVFKIIPLVKKKLIELFNGDESAARNHNYMFYGDYTGTNQSVASRGSAWSELENFWRQDGWKCTLKLRPNPMFDRRVTAVNSRLCAADGKRHITVNPAASYLIKDFRMVSLADLKKEKSKVGDYTHSSDGFGYLVHNEFPPFNSKWYDIQQ
jgi:hypothetical protein